MDDIEGEEELREAASAVRTSAQFFVIPGQALSSGGQASTKDAIIRCKQKIRYVRLHCSWKRN